jgi:hypothetical protein
MSFNGESTPARARLAAALGAFVLAALLSGCADSGACRSGSTVAGANGRDSVVGCGGPYDEIDREIYTPGRGTDLGA